MLDLPMADALTQAVAPGTRLILVGDVDQLPSVGPGAVLRDVIACGVPSRAVRLGKIFRQAARSLIVTNAHRINQGAAPARRAAGARTPTSSSSSGATPRRPATRSSSSSPRASPTASASTPSATCRCSPP